MNYQKANKFLAKCLASGLGVGYSPIAPGTAGAVLAVGFYVLGYHLCPFSAATGHTIFALVILAFFFIGVGASNQLRGEWGKDPSRVVIDEMVGMWISLFAFPFHWKYVLVAFVLFRFFDIAKPFYIRQIDQQMPNGWGVMLDDVLAGIYSNMVLWMGIWLIKWLQ